MKRRNPVKPALFFLVSLGLTLAVLASVENAKLVPQPPVKVPPPPSGLDPREYAAAATAFRSGGLETARGDLESLANAGSLEARTVLGLYAHASGESGLALEQLRAAEGYGGDLADWRLWALAEAANAEGQAPLSSAVLWRLLEQHPESALRSRAAELLAVQAKERADWPGVLNVYRATYGSTLTREARQHLAHLSWLAATALDDTELKISAARTILVDHPLSAPELDVVELFRLSDGTVPWSDFLTTEELVSRSESLLAVELADLAVETLAEVEETERDVRWQLVNARALTAGQRGDEALASLADVVGPTAAVSNEIEWERARAALEASTPRRGRGHVMAEQRREMRQRAHEHLRTVAVGPDRDLAARSLRILFNDLLDDERFEDALETLRSLQTFDPLDTTGARALWARGWKAFSERNYSGAIGYWSELGELYPKTNYNRGALYWSARSHEKLGNRERSQDLLRQVTAVDFTDFYKRHAVDRLETDTSGVSPDDAQPSEPWPDDTVLARAERLHDLGLDQAALLELEASRPGADSRAAHALEARILAALGDRRQSILALRKAFPILGTPHQSLAPVEARQLYYPLDFYTIIEEHSRSRQLASHLVLGMIRQESAFDVDAKSWAGARGLMQIMPATGRELARRLGLRYSSERLSDPEFSIQLGTSYFRQVLEMFDGDEVLALAGYNAGPYRIKRLWRQAGSNAETDHFLEQLSYSETRNYVKRVLLYSDSYRRLYEASS